VIKKNTYELIPKLRTVTVIAEQTKKPVAEVLSAMFDLGICPYAIADDVLIFKEDQAQQIIDLVKTGKPVGRRVQ
tara:strand:- start:508 stop:732 length:225 start_codon:yes stop_codon:yes gene_type:complete